MDASQQKLSRRVILSIYIEYFLVSFNEMRINYEIHLKRCESLYICVYPLPKILEQMHKQIKRGLWQDQSKGWYELFWSLHCHQKLCCLVVVLVKSDLYNPGSSPGALSFSHDSLSKRGILKYLNVFSFSFSFLIMLIGDRRI